MNLPELENRGGLGGRRVFDDRVVAAIGRWLGPLLDVPGEYLAARITCEHRRLKPEMSPR